MMEGITYSDGEEIKSLIDLIEKEKIVKDGYRTSCIENEKGDMEFFIHFSSCGIMKEGSRLDAWFFTQDAAIKSFIFHFEEWNKKLSGKSNIYWRCKPIMTESIVKIKAYVSISRKLEEIKIYNIKARFVVSDKKFPLPSPKEAV